MIIIQTCTDNCAKISDELNISLYFLVCCTDIVSLLFYLEYFIFTFLKIPFNISHF